MTGALLLENAAVLDVRAGLRVEASVLVEGGLIREVGQGLRAPTGARRLDLRGLTLMPGLCDAHVHVTAFSADVAGLERQPATYVAARAALSLKAMLRRGFTTVRDAGGADHGLARAVREKLIEAPRLLFCGQAISQTGGHGDMRAPAQDVAHGDCCYAFGKICDGVAEVRRACRDAVRKGADHIKLMVSGGVLSPTDRIANDQLSDDELSAAVEEARAAGLYCMAHAYTPRAIVRAVAAGVRSIEHGNLLDAPTARRMRAAGTFLTPTLVTYRALARTGGLSPDQQDKLMEVLDAGCQAFELARNAQLKVAFGTDLLGPMQASQLEEFAIRGEMASPLEVIRSATLTAASLFGLEGVIGEVAPGARADLLAVQGDPLRDLAVLQDPDSRLKLILSDGDLVKDALQ